MNIGFVSTWFERGAAYVTKAYIELLKDENNIFVYARGGEAYAKGNPVWDGSHVTWGLRLSSTEIDWGHFSAWIKKNKLDVIFFNEQHDIRPVLLVKKYFLHIRVGAYIDYYTEATVSDYKFYDFLICNTKRHYSVFSKHSGAHFVPWGTDISLFRPLDREKENSSLVFFHSVGMSPRKGTVALIEAFVTGSLVEKGAKLIIHTQIDISEMLGCNIDFKKSGIEVIEKEVTAPGLYHLGDVYVYPTTIDGLGLTMYEALACGLPVITTNYPPMNEVVSEDVGRLVEVATVRSRKDGYYWPLSIVSINSLINQMLFYIENQALIDKYKQRARKYAEERLDWSTRKDVIREIFENPVSVSLNKGEIENRLRQINKDRNKAFFHAAAVNFLPARIRHIMKTLR